MGKDSSVPGSVLPKLQTSIDVYRLTSSLGIKPYLPPLILA
jgi:hypothetical protein